MSIRIVTSNKDIIPNVSVITPFWVAGAMSIISALFIVIKFHETNRNCDKTKIKLSNLFTSFTFIFKDNRVVLFGAVTFLYSFSWGLYIASMPLILKDYFEYNIMGCGLLFTLMGLGDAFSILFIQKKVLKIFTLKQTFFYATTGMCIVAIISGIIPIVSVELAGGFLIGAFHILAYASLLGMCSNSVTEKEQGLIMGGLASAGNLSMLISGIILPILISIHIFVPLYILAFVFLSGGTLMLTKDKIVICTQNS